MFLPWAEGERLDLNVGHDPTGHTIQEDCTHLACIMYLSIVLSCAITAHATPCLRLEDYCPSVKLLSEAETLPWMWRRRLP